MKFNVFIEFLPTPSNPEPNGPMKWVHEGNELSVIVAVSQRLEEVNDTWAPIKSIKIDVVR